MRYREYDCIVDGNMEQCLEEIEVRDLGEHVYYGPQAEIMEELTRFNTRYNANLEITKTFKWKRGSYERVSELMMRGLGFRRKPSGMYNYHQIQYQGHVLLLQMSYHREFYKPQDQV